MEDCGLGDGGVLCRVWCSYCLEKGAGLAIGLLHFSGERIRVCRCQCPPDSWLVVNAQVVLGDEGKRLSNT